MKARLLRLAAAAALGVLGPLTARLLAHAEQPALRPVVLVGRGAQLGAVRHVTLHLEDGPP